uniref:Collagen, type XXVIII, alpha 1b n=1 Tax=Oncorhynchus mykiss TaxID=8022 RepID=A0A8C7PK50_ONCMY
SNWLGLAPNWVGLCPPPGPPMTALSNRSPCETHVCIPLPDMTTCSMEVAFILDSSESAKTFLFEKQKSFVLHFSTRLTMLQVSGWTLKLRMAALQYSSSVSIEHSFTAWQDLDVFHSRVSSMAYIGHGTYSTYAITNATQLFTQETKEDSVRVEVLMTDGADHPRNPDVIGAAADAKASGVKLFAVGLSDLARQSQKSAKLRAIASTPAQQFVHSLTDPQLEEKLLKELVSVLSSKLPYTQVEDDWYAEPRQHGVLTNSHCDCTPLTQGDQGPTGASGPAGDIGIGFPGPKGAKGIQGRPGTLGPIGIGEPGQPVSITVDASFGYLNSDRYGNVIHDPILLPLIHVSRLDNGNLKIKINVYIHLVNMMPHILFVLQGSQGFSGEPGIPGERGVGEPGPKGDPGSEGLPGIPGLSGEDGDIGQKGDIGLQGPRGPDGAPGKGVPGEKGDRGERGSRGQLGAVGPVGPMGAKGEPGSAGRAGTNGPPGRGLPGIKGDPGAVGPPGHVGERGIGITGPKGDRGTPGPTGPAGAPGVGLMGPKGSAGQIGAPGPQGVPGEGIQGPKGESGFQGITGPRGPPGQVLMLSKGFVGERGRKGDRGETGERGAAGPLVLREEVIKLVRSICGCGVKCRESPLEMVFVIDSSESVGPDNFNVVKDFVNALVDRASVSRETTHVGVVLYSLDFDLAILTPGYVKAAVRTMTYLGEGTFTGSAIHQANQVFRAARPGVRKVAIVITDGQADERDTVRLEEAVKEANGSNIEMFVIGVVNESDPLYEEFKKELHLMASDPDREHVYLIDDFRTLPALESKLLSRICESDGGAQFSSIPSSRYSPGTPGQAGIVRETPERTDTDTPTFNGDFKKTQMVVRMTTLPLYIMHLTDISPSKINILHFSSLFPDESCGQILDPGPCRNYVVKWYYDTTANACAQFWFGGCQGNQNQFESEKSCKKTCVKV